jgi:hypothetical protein
MLKSLATLVFTVAGTALILPGCLFTSHSDRVIEPGAARQTVKFESGTGLAQFQAAVEKRFKAGEAVHSESDFAIPFVIHAETRETLSENAFYNDQITKADVDGDGLISDDESRAYAGC